MYHNFLKVWDCIQQNTLAHVNKTKDSYKLETKKKERPRGRAVMSAVTAVSGVGSRPALATCETRQVLLAGVPGGFSRGSPVFAPPTD